MISRYYSSSTRVLWKFGYQHPGEITVIQMIGNMAIEYTGSYCFTVVKVSSQRQLQMSGVPTGHRFNTNIVFPGTLIPITEMGRSWELLILIMGISLSAMKHFYSETTPGCWYSTFCTRGSQRALNLWTCYLSSRKLTCLHLDFSA